MPLFIEVIILPQEISIPSKEQKKEGPGDQLKKKKEKCPHWENRGRCKFGEIKVNVRKAFVQNQGVECRSARYAYRNEDSPRAR